MMGDMAALGEFLSNNLLWIWLICVLATFVSGLLAIFLERGKEKLFGVPLLVSGVLLLLIGLFVMPIYDTTYDIYLATLLSILFIIVICASFVAAIEIVRDRIAAKSAAPPPQVVTESRVTTASQPVGEISQTPFPRELTVTAPAPYPYLQIFNITWLNIFWMILVFGLLLIILGFPILYTVGAIFGSCSAVGICYWVKKRKYSQKVRPEKVKPVVPTPFELHTCEICMGAIKKGLAVVKCGCGRTYHMSCIKRVGTCPFCGVSL